MSKKAIVTDHDKRIPPIPGSPEAEGGDSSSPSTFTEKTEAPLRTDHVSEEFAGDIYKIPFQVWHGFDPDTPEEPDPRQVQAVAAPLARVMEKYGLGKIAKDEILVGFYISQTVFVYIKASREAKKARTLAGSIKPE